MAPPLSNPPLSLPVKAPNRTRWWSLILALLLAFTRPGTLGAFPEPRPDLVPVDLSASVARAIWYDEVTIHWSVENGGSAAIGEGTMWNDAIFLSRDTTFDSGDEPWWPPSEQIRGPVEAHDRYDATISGQIPLLPGGLYYVLLIVDPDDALAETDDTNNLFIGPAIEIVAVNADLMATSATANTDAVEWGDAFTVQWSVTNTRSDPLPTGGWWFNSLMLSTDRQLDGDDIVLDVVEQHGPLAIGERRAFTTHAVMPWIEADIAYVLAVANYQGYEPGWRPLWERVDANNVYVGTALSVSGLEIDLVPGDLEVTPVAARAGEPISVSWTIRNDGPDDLPGTRDLTATLYRSDNAVLDGDDPPLAAVALPVPLASGAATTMETSFTVPPDEIGTFTIILRANCWYCGEFGGVDGFPEPDADNNVLVGPTISVSGTYDVDLAPRSLVASKTSVAWGESIVAAWDVDIAGADEIPAGITWQDRVYLSRDGTLDDRDTALAGADIPEMLRASGVYRADASGTVPRLPSGTYTLLLLVDRFDDMAETDESNNVLRGPDIVVLGTDVDLVVTGFSSEAVAAVVGEEVPLSWAVTNGGTDEIPETSWWLDAVFLSTDEVLDADDLKLGHSQRWGPLLPGGRYDARMDPPMPDVPPGDYVLILDVANHYLGRDGGRDVFQVEANRENSQAMVRIAITARDDWRASEPGFPCALDRPGRISGGVLP